MNLPKPWNKECKMTYYFISCKTSVAEFLFLGKIIIQSFTKFRCITIQNSRTIKYPFFFCDIIISDFACMLVNTWEKFSVNTYIFTGRKWKRFLRKNGSNSDRNFVCFFCSVALIIFRIFQIIAFNSLLSIGYGNVSFDIFNSGFNQLIGSFKAINSLQTYCSTPGISLILFVRFRLF